MNGGGTETSIIDVPNSVMSAHQFLWSKFTAFQPPPHPLTTHQDVAALDVPVHDLVLVQVRQPLRRLLRVHRRHVFAEGSELAWPQGAWKFVVVGGETPIDPRSQPLALSHTPFKKHRTKKT